jgi:hypothetical protein
MNQHVVIFYVLFSVARTLFDVVRVNGAGKSIVLLLLTVLAASVFSDGTNGPAIFAPMIISFPLATLAIAVEGFHST